MDFNGIDFWYYDLELNIIPIQLKGKNPLISWKEWQDKIIPIEVYEKWKKKDCVDNNYALITGKIHRGQFKDKYIICIDIDNKAGINEFIQHFTEIKSLQELAQKTMIVQHVDSKDEKAHIYFITETPMKKRCSSSGLRNGIDNKEDIPFIEVKSDSSTYVVCPPSTHPNGHLYQIIGTNNIQVLNPEKTKNLENTLNEIIGKYDKKILHHY